MTDTDTGANVRELTPQEIDAVSGGIWQWFINSWIDGMSGGYCGYGAGGEYCDWTEGEVLKKNPKGGSNK